MGLGPYSVRIDERIEYDLEDDDWRQQWLHFVCTLPSVGLPPGGDDSESKYYWIDDAVRAFCEAQSTCAQFLAARSKEDAA